MHEMHEKITCTPFLLEIFLYYGHRCPSSSELGFQLLLDRAIANMGLMIIALIVAAIHEGTLYLKET